MRLRTKKPAITTCEQCGTRLRGRATCPRGPQCARDQADHDNLMARIATDDERKKSQK